MLYVGTSGVGIKNISRFSPSASFSIGLQHFDKLSVQRILINTSPHSLRHSSLTYQLLQIPTADLHISLVFIQALGELLCIHLAAAWSPGIVLLVASGSHAIILLLFCGSLRGSATEETTDCVADRGADCYTSVRSWSV
jgi:hypothetical protein